MKADQERVSKLLTDTVTLLCKNGLIYKDEIKVQGLLGITLDRDDVFIVHINESIGSGAPKDIPSDGTWKKGQISGVPVVDLTRIVDTPLTSASLRGMGPLVPGMSQPMGGSGSGSSGLSTRKQRPLMAQMMPRGQYLPMPRFRTGMSPASMHSMASVMNNHSMYSRQSGSLSAMQQMRQRLPVVPPLMTQSKCQQMQPPATVAIDDDDDVVIIGTGHEEPSPNWNMPVRRNQQSRLKNQQPQHVNNTGQNKLSESISLSDTTTVSSSSNSDIDQLQMTTALTESERNIAEISLSELSTASSGQPNPGLIMNEGTVEEKATSVDMSSATSAMVVEPSDRDSDVDSVTPGGDAEVRESSTGEKSLSEISAANDNSANGIISSEFENCFKADPDAPDEATLLSTEKTDRAGIDNESFESQNSSEKEKDLLPNTDQQISVPTVCTNVADDPEPPQLEGVQVTDMDIQTLGFDVLTQEEHDASHSSSQLAEWNCKLSGCNASFEDACSLASHYTLHHTDQLDLLPNPSDVPPATDSSTSESGEQDSADGTIRKKLFKVMHCPFAGCQNKFSSWPGLNLHHKIVHKALISKAERNKILAIYGKPYKYSFTPVCQKSYAMKRDLSRHVMKVRDVPKDTDVDVDVPTVRLADMASTAVASEFGYPTEVEFSPRANETVPCSVSSCEVVCDSHETFVEQLQTCLGTDGVPDKPSFPEVKDETIEDQ